MSRSTHNYFHLNIRRYIFWSSDDLFVSKWVVLGHQKCSEGSFLRLQSKVWLGLTYRISLTHSPSATSLIHLWCSIITDLLSTELNTPHDQGTDPVPIGWQSEIDQFERAMSGTGNWIAMIIMINAFLSLIHLAFTQTGFHLPSCVLPGNWKHNPGITTDYRNMIMMTVMMSVLTEACGRALTDCNVNRSIERTLK